MLRRIDAEIPVSGLMRDPILRLDLTDEHVAFTGNLLKFIIRDLPQVCFTLPVNSVQLPCT
jgi:hypothetical protein